VLAAPDLVLAASDLVLAASGLVLAASGLVLAASGLVLAASDLVLAASDLVLAASDFIFSKKLIKSTEMLRYQCVDSLQINSSFTKKMLKTFISLNVKLGHLGCVLLRVTSTECSTCSLHPLGIPP
jgi:hypothetical protein